MTDVESKNMDQPLEEFELQTELTAIITKNMIPARVVEKIVAKLKEKNVKISKKQLYALIDKISTVIRTSVKHDNKPQQPTNKEEGEAPRIETATSTIEKPLVSNTREVNTDMKKLVDIIEQLKERITMIEKNHLEGVKMSPVKTVLARDIQTVEKTVVSIPAETMSPLLEIRTDPESIVVLMKWLQYLVEKIGKTQLPDVLGYYVDIGWISEDVRLDLLNYSKGIIEENKGEARRDSANLPTKDHLQSLLFIQKLKGIQVDERFVYRIDREIEKLAKSLETYPIK